MIVDAEGKGQIPNTKTFHIHPLFIVANILNLQR